MWITSLLTGIAALVSLLTSETQRQIDLLSDLGARLPQPACTRVVFETHQLITCRVDPARHAYRIRNGNEAGGRATLPDFVEALSPEKVVFAMNAGMYTGLFWTEPLGLYIANGRQVTPLNRHKGGGNFFLKPNGVFFVKDGLPAVQESEAYRASGHQPELASQSGPMLVIDGEIHPRIILPTSDYLNIRNGVGVARDGQAIFMISQAPISFGVMARFFRDHLDCPNALYFDGDVSRLYSAELRLSGGGQYLGPMIAVVER